MEFITVEQGPIRLNVAVAGHGPLLLCVHGWPELWYSWRHQIAHFSVRGYTVAALDVRGYGGSSKPGPVEAYTLRNLALDVAAVIDRLGGGRAILVGHDWGAPIAWMTTLLHPGRVAAVALLSVPYIPLGATSFIDMMKAIYHDRFFYQVYIQDEGRAEAEVEADIPGSLRRIYFAMSGSAPLYQWLAPRPRDATLLQDLPDPRPFPDWMSDQDMQVYVEAFRTGGFRGPFNRYRAQNLDFAELQEFTRRPLAHPSCFIGGERDMVRALIPGVDLYQAPGVACTDFRGATILPGIGHWVQQEAPADTNAALERFLATLQGV